MPNILHRVSISASPESVHELIATREGIEQWWTSKPVTGDEDRFAVFFSNVDRPAATFDVLESTSQQTVWRCAEGPSDWIDTKIKFALAEAGDGGTTLLFTHEGWAGESEFMHGCSTNWAAYLMSLKSGAEGQGFNAYPGGEISRWS